MIFLSHEEETNYLSKLILNAVVSTKHDSSLLDGALYI